MVINIIVFAIGVFVGGKYPKVYDSVSNALNQIVNLFKTKK